MIIANPIYDVVFKRLMEDERVAKFFIGTLLDTQIEALEVKPQEFTFIKELDQDDPQAQQYIREQLRERLTINVQRLDFVATIRLAGGQHQKVLIEIQKAKNQIDLVRFRNYLAEQYKKQDQVGGAKVVLPITTIYILGFTLPDLEAACVKVERNYRDLVNRTVMEKKSDFVEKLSHDCYIVQVERITDRYQTRLDKLLSIFEQRHFTDETRTVKEYRHQPDSEEVKLTTDILHHSGTDPEERKKIETEQEAWRTMNAMFEDKERELRKTIDEQAQALDEAKKQNDDLLKELEELKRRLNKPK
jgi:hypothetical protein